MIAANLHSRAAELAFAMLRFTQPAAHQFSTPPREGAPEPGVDWFIFSPSSRRIAKDEVPGFLIDLDSPVMMLPTIYRGSVALLVLNEMEGERGDWIQKKLDNQVAAIAECEARLKLGPHSPILLQFAEEEHLFPFSVVREWAQRYCVGVGWNVISCADSRADARLMLLGPAGLQAWGGSCPNALPD